VELNKIYNENNLDTMSRIPDNFIDLVITSPPYNCKIKYDIYDDDRSWSDYITWCEAWLIEIYRILKPDGRICLNILLEMGINDNKVRVSPYAEFYKLFDKIGIKHRGAPVWTDSHKSKLCSWGSWLKASAPYIWCPFEIIMIGYKEIWKKQTQGENTISKDDFIMGCGGVWKLRTQTKEITKANFHTDLPDMCINLLSYVNDIVYDPFMGGGTTAVSALKHNRRYIGSEISPNYCEIAENRITTQRKEEEV